MADELQTVTTNDKTEFDKLEPAEQEIVYMRVDGYPVRAIWRMVNSYTDPDKRFKYGSVRNWFSPDGKLYLAYQEKLEEKKADIQDRRKQAEELLASGVNEAIIVITNLVKKGKFEAAQDLLDRAGISATRKVELTDDREINDKLDKLQVIIDKYGTANKSKPV